MKKLVKSLTVLALTFVVGYIYPVTSYAAFTTPGNVFRGTYDHLTNDVSFIKVNPEDVSAIVVYSEEKNRYITATNGTGYMQNGSFSANFEGYLVTDSDGFTIKSYSGYVGLKGTYKKSNDYIDIIVGGIVYEKKL